MREMLHPFHQSRAWDHMMFTKHKKMVVLSQREQFFWSTSMGINVDIFLPEAVHKEKRFWNVLILQVRPFHTNALSENGVYPTM